MCVACKGENFNSQGGIGQKARRNLIRRAKANKRLSFSTYELVIEFYSLSNCQVIVLFAQRGTTPSTTGGTSHDFFVILILLVFFGKP